MSSLIDQALLAHQSGDAAGALALCGQILHLQAEECNALHLSAVLTLEQGEAAAAIPVFRRVIELYGPHRDFLYNLGNALREAGQDKEAISTYRTLLARDPQDVAVINNLGLAYRDAGQFSDARGCFEAALPYAPNDPDLLSNLGITLFDLNQVEAAIATYTRAIEHAPDRAEILSNLGIAQLQAGDAEGALVALERAVALAPDYPEAHSNLIFCLDFLGNGSSEAQQGERRRWAARHARGIVPYRDFPSQRRHAATPGHKLRIGYLSADFRRHSAASAFGPLLLNYDRERFEVVCFSNSRINDAQTERFRAAVDDWCDVYRLADDVAAKLIYDQDIDILVDLGGHARDNRLRVMAHKPAPVQASGWGHANGTGLAAVDYLFADPVYINAEDRIHFAETVLDLPCALGYAAHAEPPAETPLPALHNGHITFGSFNRAAKIGTALPAWAEVLKSIPGSRMVFKAPEFSSPELGEKLRAFFDQRGVDAGRISVFGNTAWHEHLQTIGTVDIALDPFPHGGGVTVFDCLVMGVPVLAVGSPLPTGRLAQGVLHSQGLDDWVAADPGRLTALAQAKVADTTKLVELRRKLRPGLLTSPAGDPRRYVRAVEAHYQAIWRIWADRAQDGAQDGARR